jgi:hypothetical protein
MLVHRLRGWVPTPEIGGGVRDSDISVSVLTGVSPRVFSSLLLSAT